MEFVELMDTATATVVVALITLLGSLTGTIFAYLGRKEARGANQAVNNVQPDQPKLYDIVAQTQKDFVSHVAVNEVQHREMGLALEENRMAHRDTQRRLDDAIREGTRARAGIKDELDDFKKTAIPLLEDE